MIYGRHHYAPNGLTRACFDELANGAGTSMEIAATTGYPLHSVSAILSQLHKRGDVVRRRMAGQSAYLYEVAE